MEYAILFLLLTFVSGVSLLIVIPIAQKLADFSMPPWPETLWKLALVAAGVNAIGLALDPVNVFLSWIVGAVAFWTIMVKWFDVDLFGAMVIVVVSWVARIILGQILVGIVEAAF